MKDDRDLPLKGIREEYSSERYSCIAKTIVLPLASEIRSRILSADNMLSCVSEGPLLFVVLLPDIDDTLNMSTKSIDYDGDCEDYNDLGTDSSSDEESFYVGRSRLASYRSVDDFTDDETTMDSESFNLAALKWEHSPRKTVEPDLCEDDKIKSNEFRFPAEIGSPALKAQKDLRTIKNGKSRRLKRKANVRIGYTHRKRTRSNALAQSR